MSYNFDRIKILRHQNWGENRRFFDKFSINFNKFSVFSRKKKEGSDLAASKQNAFPIFPSVPKKICGQKI